MDKDSNILMQGTALSPARNSPWAIASFASAMVCLTGLLTAIVLPSLVYMFLAFPAAIVSGHLARRQLAKSAGRLRGAGMATFGLSIGYFALFLSLFVIGAMIFGLTRSGAGQV